MRSARAVVPCAFLLAATACSPSVTPSTSTRPAPVVANRSSTAATLKIPPGHLPPVGSCRIWRPGTPPGHQAPSRSCVGIERQAPAGSWILYRPTGDRKVVHVREVDGYRPGVIGRIRVHDARSGAYLHEASSSDEHAAADPAPRARKEKR